MSFDEVRIGDLCDLINGRAFKPTDWTETGLPIVRIQNLNDEQKPFNYYDGNVRPRFHIDSGELLFSWSGTPGTSFGAFFWDRGPALLNQHIFRVLVEPNRVNKAYFRYALNHRLQRVIDQAHGGVGLKHITKGRLEDTTVPLPPLDEQKRIAAILDKADEIRRKQQQAIELTDELLDSAFVHFFGDPVLNPQGFTVDAFGEHLRDIQSGWSPKCDSEPARQGEWGVLKLGAISYGRFNPAEQKALLSPAQPRPKLELVTGDLLFARKNTYELVGAAALVQSVRPKLMFPDLIFRLVPTGDLDRVYLWRLLRHPGMRGELSRLASGAAASMPNISKTRLKTLEIPIPPLALQREFRSFVERHTALCEQHAAALSEVNHLTASLSQRAFAGEL